jgi:hypothetical protein
MIFLIGIILVIIAFALYLVDYFVIDYFHREKLFWTAIVPYVLLVTTVILMVVGAGLSIFVEFDQEVVVSRVEIVSLEGDRSTGQSFVLGTGRVDSKSIYIAYTPISENSYELYEFSADDNVIIEDDSVNPVVITYEPKTESAFLNWLLLPKERRTETYVPEGYITKFAD